MKFFRWLLGRKLEQLSFTYIGRVRIEGSTTHYDAHRLEIRFKGGRYAGHRIVPGKAVDLLSGPQLETAWQ